MRFERRRDAGLLVVVEGIDGAGKTTLRDGLAERIEQTGVDRSVHVTCEPSLSNWFGRGLRGGWFSTPKERLLAFLLDRIAHQRDVVSPLLREGGLVIQDRSWHSTIAYQGSEVAEEDLAAMMEVHPPLKPDLLFIIDLPVQLATERVQRRGRALADAGVIDPYLLTWQLEPVLERYRQFDEAVFLDGTLPADVLVSQAMRAIRAALELSVKEEHHATVT